MKIKVKSEDCNISLLLPNALLLNRLTARIVAHYINKANKNFQMTEAQIRKIFATIKQCKKDFPKMYLVEVDSEDGDIVKIRL
ncbi:hypothetical protein RBG61_12575 [Paludicola sp. MB14-C6]|uniref:hypothetical protein n=1 Tax=Paludihabitans sp. MB14-C6 TaxID=3070656 RepID=UPI0027DE32DA|nr:hypothetical protein [Paludicola sp. MB14-C6]WMJ22816.1 hypothetical protein RBG61_12575 [Paludicola sp. MB14-C6]